MVYKFDYVVSNPPYQDRSSRPIFQSFQNLANNVSKNTIMIYMASRWWYGTTGLSQFRSEQLLNKRLHKVCFYHERESARNIFHGTLISGGLTIVHFTEKENKNGFELYENLTSYSTILSHCSIINPIKASSVSIAQKIDKIIEENIFQRLSQRSETGFVNEIGLNAQQIKTLNPTFYREAEKYLVQEELDNHLKLYANVSGERTGKSELYIIERNQLVLKNNKYKKNLIQEDKHKVCMGQSIIENENRSIRLLKFPKNTTYGRAAVSLAFFETEKEANNFHKYASTKFFEFCLRLTIAGRLSNLGYFIPDFINYSKSHIIDWDKFSVEEIDQELFKLFKLDKNEIQLIQNFKLLNLNQH